MRSSALLSFLAISPSFLASAAAAPVSKPGELLNGLGIDFGEPGPVYVSDDKWDCPVYEIKLDGHGMLELAAVVSLPYPKDTSKQETVDIGKVDTLWDRTAKWKPRLPGWTSFVMRVMDDQKRVRYSVEKWTVEGDKEHCSPVLSLHRPTEEATAGQPTTKQTKPSATSFLPHTTSTSPSRSWHSSDHFLLGMLVGALIIGVIWAGCECWRRRKRIMKWLEDNRLAYSPVARQEALDGEEEKEGDIRGAERGRV